MTKTTRYSPEVRERAVRLVQEHAAGAPLAVGGDHVDRREDRLYGGDAPPLGASGRAGCGPAARADDGRAGSGSRSWSGRIASSAARTRFCGRRRRISPRRSSTAAGRDGGVHRRPPGGVRSRADLRGAADRSVDLLRAEGAGRPIPRGGPPAPSATPGWAPEIAPGVADPPAGLRGRRRSGSSSGARDTSVARCTVARLMRAMGLRGVVRGRRVQDHDPRRAGRRPQDLVQRQLHRDPAESAVGLGLHLRRDLAGLRVRRLRDRCLRRRIVGWRAATSTAERLGARRAGAGPVRPGDRRRRGPTGPPQRPGRCNISPSATPSGWPTAGIEPSVGSRGDSYDNALAETVIGLFKTEVIRRRRPVAGRRRGRVCHARVGRVVQQPAPAGTARATSRRRSTRSSTTVPRPIARPWYSTNRASGKPGAVQLNSCTSGAVRTDKRTHTLHLSSTGLKLHTLYLASSCWVGCATHGAADGRPGRPPRPLLGPRPTGSRPQLTPGSRHFATNH